MKGENLSICIVAKTLLFTPLRSRAGYRNQPGAHQGAHWSSSHQRWPLGRLYHLPQHIAERAPDGRRFACTGQRVNLARRRCGSVDRLPVRHSAHRDSCSRASGFLSHDVPLARAVDGKVVGAEKLVADFESRALSVSERILEPLGVPGTLVHTRPAPVSPSSYCCMFASRLTYPTTPHLANSRSDRARQPLPLPPPSRACPAGMRSRPVLNNRRPLIATVVASRAPRHAVPHTLHRPAAHAAREANRDPFARATPCPCHRPAACVRPPCAHEHPRTPANTPANTREPPETHERPERPETLDKFWTII